jgi:phage terminase small subunit
VGRGPKTKAKLSIQQQRFVEEYLVDLNATQAALRAGYSTKTAYSQGQRLLKHVEIKKKLRAVQDKRSENVGRTAEDVLADIIAVGNTALKAGNLKAALKSLELQGKHLGMFVDRVRHEGLEGLEAAILKARARVSSGPNRE